MAVHQMAEEGFLGRADEILAAMDELIAGTLKKHPGARACWDAVKASQIHRDSLDSLMEELDVSERLVMGEAIVSPKQPS